MQLWPVEMKRHWTMGVSTNQILISAAATIWQCMYIMKGYIVSVYPVYDGSYPKMSYIPLLIQCIPFLTKVFVPPVSSLDLRPPTEHGEADPPGVENWAYECGSSGFCIGEMGFSQDFQPQLLHNYWEIAQDGSFQKRPPSKVVLKRSHSTLQDRLCESLWVQQPRLEVWKEKIQQRMLFVSLHEALVKLLSYSTMPPPRPIGELHFFLW